MASTGLNFNNITPPNGAVRDLNELVFKDVLSAERLGSILNVFPRTFDGDKLDVIGEFGLLGKASQGCSPVYGNDTINTTEKTWNVKEWEIAESICYKDLEGTLVKYALNSGTDIDDITSNEYLEQVVLPRLELAIYKMLVRIAFFGDTAAKTTADGGTLLVGTDPAYFKITDGYWKQIFAIVAGDAARRVTIAANAEATKAGQMAGIATTAVATINDLINTAKPALRQAEDQVIYMTQSLADALEVNLLTSFIGSDLHWQDLFGGIREGRYRGVKIRVLPIWDEIIQSYEGTAAAYNLPHRAIYTTERNLALGVTGTSEFKDVDVFFDRTTRLNHIFAKDKVGALVVVDDLIQVAY